MLAVVTLFATVSQTVCAAFSVVGMEAIDSIRVPESVFHGSASVAVDTRSPWMLVAPGCFAVEIEPSNTKQSSPIGENLVRYRLYRFDGNDYVDCSKAEVISAAAATGLSMRFDNHNVVFSGNGGESLFELPLWSAADGYAELHYGAPLAVYARKKARIVRKDARFEVYPILEKVDISSLSPDGGDDSQKRYVGRWRYFDRRTPSSGEVRVSGPLEVAVVPDTSADSPRGSLVIVYLGGDEVNPDLWRPGDVKGRLRPTGFAGHYDLEWFGSKRNRVDASESSATFDGVNILTLSFPLLDSQIRFERLLDL